MRLLTFPSMATILPHPLPNEEIRGRQETDGNGE